MPPGTNTSAPVRSRPAPAFATLRVCFPVLLAASLLLTGCQAIHYSKVREPSWQLSSPRNSPQDQLYAEACERHPGQTGFRILTYGPEALLARASIVDTATHTLDLQYYIFDPDKVGHTMIQRLLEAADHGVRVRILLDDNNQGNDRPLIILSAHPNISVRIFNPFRYRARWLRIPQYLTDLARVNRRMHNKVLIADNRLAILGGRNIGENYFDISESNNFRDFDLFMAGPLVTDASAAFDDYWNSPWAIPAEDLAQSSVTQEELDLFRRKHAEWVLEAPDDRSKYTSLRNEYTRQVLDRPEDLVWATGRLFWDPPGKMQVTTEDTTPVALRLDREMKDCNTECLIEEGYFIPGDDGMVQIKELRKRGVTVHVLTSALEATDQPLVYSAYRRYRQELLESGVELNEYKLHARIPPAKKRWFHTRKAPSSLHSKVMVFDHERIWIGSFNYDSRSVRYNTEIAALIDSPKLAEQLSSLINEGCRPEASWKVLLDKSTHPPRLLWQGEENGEDTTLLHEPSRGWWHRFRVRLYSMVPGIEDLL
jgi:putative cardiolipin synthase